MKRALKWLLPTLGVLQFVLLRAHLLDARATIRVVALIEIALLLVAGRQVFAAVRTYRRDRVAGLAVWQAIEDGFAVLMPRHVARLALLEPKLWFCLARWTLRRRRADPDAFPYHKRAIIGPILLVACLTAPAEIAVGAVLLPWPWLRLLFLIGSLYTLFWLVGFYASLRVLPHRLEPNGIRIRFGVFAEGVIPYHAIAGIAVERRTAPGGRDGLQLSPERTIAYLATGGRTDVTLTLKEAQALEGLGGATTPVAMICLATDAPHALGAALGARAGLPVRAMTQGIQPATMIRPTYRPLRVG